MFRKLTFFLLLANVVTMLSVGYVVYTSSQKKPQFVEIEVPVEDKEFQANMYKGMSMLMTGQSQLASNQEDLNMSIFRVHHFVEPHANTFYKDCPECQMERQNILEDEKESVTLNK